MAEAVKVIVRCRPMNTREKDLKCKTVVDMTEGVTCVLHNTDPNNPPKSFTFDGAYHIDSTTEQIYNDVGYALVEGVLEGYNGTVFAYGQTGCGKSFTMQGITDPATQRGIIPRSFEHIFEVIQTTENMKFLVFASYLEIYNEQIRDLLSTDTKKPLELKEHKEKGVYVQGLSQHPVHNTQECEVLMEKGWGNRSTGATNMNKDSSRSHSIFTITMEMLDMADNADSIRTGKLNLVDLAGSERQAKTGATGDRLTEATKINLSLSALGNVISALVDGKSKHIPYRDSKLTRLLQDSLGGNTKTLMVACLSPADNNYDETLSTLRYANRAKNIKNKPKINEDPKDAMLREYQEEIKKLKDLLESKGPQEEGHGTWATRVHPETVTVVPDESALEKEREKIRDEYEEKMKQMQEKMNRELQNNAKLVGDMEGMKKKYEEELNTVNSKLQTNKTNITASDEDSSNAIDINGQLNNTEIIINNNDDIADLTENNMHNFTHNTPTQENVKSQNNDMMNTMQTQALKRLKQLEQQMVGGEKSQDNELKAKRQRRKKYMEKRMNILSEALKEVDDDDGIMLKVYDDIHEELKAKTEITKKQKQKIKSLDQELNDVTTEFQQERSDYLETIRKQDQTVKLLQAILDKIQPTIRRDSNYHDLDSVKKLAIWDDEYQRWKIPELTIIKTKLPPAGPVNSTESHFMSKTNLSSSYDSSFSPTHNTSRTTAGGRMPHESSTAPAARHRSWYDEEDDSKLLKKLELGDDSYARTYFQPKKRANELLTRFQSDNDVYNAAAERQKKNSTTALNQSMSQNMWGNTMNFNNSFNNSQGSSSGALWGPFSSFNVSSNGISGTNNSPGSTTGGNVISNGWTVSVVSPEMRRPMKLEALPTLDKKTRKKSKEVLHTLELI